MKTKTINLYSFDELSDKAKQKALENLYDINVDYDWWQYTYEDAERVGLRINGFDLDRGSYCEGDFLEDAKTVAELILKEHGEQCETYKTAKEFLSNYLPVLKELEVYQAEDENELNQDLIDSLDEKCCDLIDEFEKSIFEDYRIILQNEYEYLISEEAIKETIERNEYTFTEDGKLCN